jgi:hypothetical protein
VFSRLAEIAVWEGRLVANRGEAAAVAHRLRLTG